MENDEFDDWCERFTASRKGKAALKELKAHYEDDNQKEFRRLERLVLRACYHALTYSIDHDPYELERRRNSVCADELDSVNKAIAVIREFSNKCPDIIGWALGVAPPQPGEKFDPNDSLQDDILLARLLKKLSRGLECTRGKNIAKYHRMRQGNLIYPAPVDQYAARPNIDVLGMIFELVFLFRRWTSLVRGRREPGLPYPGEASFGEYSSAATNDLHQIFSFPDQGWFSRWEGTSLPTEGRPNYKLVAAFLNAAFHPTAKKGMKSSLVKERLRRLLRNHPSVGLCPWPHAEKVDS